MELIVSKQDFVRLMALRPPAELQAELELSIVVPAESVDPAVVTLGSRVRYQDENTGQIREIEIVSPEEADMASDRVSVFTPVGTALFGLSAGNGTNWDFPDGSVRRLNILHVSQATKSCHPAD
ncbi:GreA/GreB family elongation factor [Azonexus sp.]|uniref:GreA/GreB family elongation factor n=1 Tax=Azonexus sp. TaxID=1872668 RepID=UPI0027BA079D|nr:GreA/GreB family elongation factor [Azonexus sp.]